ncbi:MAG: hypothetical protein ACYC35_25465 [Pirellulales bacterium]
MAEPKSAEPDKGGSTPPAGPDADQAAKPPAGAEGGEGKDGNHSKPNPRRGKPKRGRPVDPLTVQRRDFAGPLKEGRTWEEIAALYKRKYPKDLEANADTIRLACERNNGPK